MNEIELLCTNILVLLTNKFNYDIDYIEMLNEEERKSFDIFLKNRGQSLLDTINYIKVYNEMYKRLCELSLPSNIMNINTNEQIYSLEYLEELINIYNSQKNNIIVINLLISQRNLLYKYLYEAEILIKKLIRFLIAMSAEDEGETSSGESLDDSLEKLLEIFRTKYGIKKQNIMIKMLIKN